MSHCRKQMLIESTQRTVRALVEACVQGRLRGGGVRRRGAASFLSAHSATLSQSSSDVSPGSGKIRHLEESAEFQTKKLVTVIVILVGSLSPLSLILVDLDLQLAVERSRGHLR